MIWCRNVGMADVFMHVCIFYTLNFGEVRGSILQINFGNASSGCYPCSGMLGAACTTNRCKFRQQKALTKCIQQGSKKRGERRELS